MSDDRARICRDDIEHSEIIGRELKIRTEQFPGKILDSKVIGISGDSLIIDRSGSSGLVNELINKQPIEVYLEYKGEPVVFSSTVATPRRGKLQIPIAENIYPEICRAFKRVKMEKDIRLTFFNDTCISTARLNKLKWIETKTVDIGGGGLMALLPVDLNGEYFLIIHLGFENLQIPNLVVGQVRHSRSNINKMYHAGVEFIIKENYKNKLPNVLIRNLPGGLFVFDDKCRKILENYLTETNRNVLTGV